MSNSQKQTFGSDIVKIFTYAKYMTKIKSTFNFIIIKTIIMEIKLLQTSTVHHDRHPIKLF